MGILITSSRKPCKRTHIFCRELEQALQNAFYVARGKSSLEELLEFAKHEKSRVIHVGDYKGNPGKFVVLNEDGSATASILLKSVVLKREQRELLLAEGDQTIADAICTALGVNAGAIKQRGCSIFFERGPEIRVRSFKLGSEAKL